MSIERTKKDINQLNTNVGFVSPTGLREQSAMFDSLSNNMMQRVLKEQEEQGIEIQKKAELDAMNSVKYDENGNPILDKREVDSNTIYGKTYEKVVAKAYGDSVLNSLNLNAEKILLQNQYDATGFVEQFDSYAITKINNVDPAVRPILEQEYNAIKQKALFKITSNNIERQNNEMIDTFTQRVDDLTKNITDGITSDVNFVNSTDYNLEVAKLNDTLKALKSIPNVDRSKISLIEEKINKTIYKASIVGMQNNLDVNDIDGWNKLVKHVRDDDKSPFDFEERMQLSESIQNKMYNSINNAIFTKKMKLQQKEEEQRKNYINLLSNIPKGVNRFEYIQEQVTNNPDLYPKDLGSSIISSYINDSINNIEIAYRNNDIVSINTIYDDFYEKLLKNPVNKDLIDGFSKIKKSKFKYLMNLSEDKRKTALLVSIENGTFDIENKDLSEQIFKLFGKDSTTLLTKAKNKWNDRIKKINNRKILDRKIEKGLKLSDKEVNNFFKESYSDLSLSLDENGVNFLTDFVKKTYNLPTEAKKLINDTLSGTADDVRSVIDLYSNINKELGEVNAQNIFGKTILNKNKFKNLLKIINNRKYMILNDDELINELNKSTDSGSDDRRLRDVVGKDYENKILDYIDENLARPQDRLGIIDFNSIPVINWFINDSTPSLTILPFAGDKNRILTDVMNRFKSKSLINFNDEIYVSDNLKNVLAEKIKNNISSGIFEDLDDAFVNAVSESIDKIGINVTENGDPYLDIGGLITDMNEPSEFDLTFASNDLLSIPVTKEILDVDILNILSKQTGLSINEINKKFNTEKIKYEKNDFGNYDVFIKEEGTGRYVNIINNYKFSRVNSFVGELEKEAEKLKQDFIKTDAKNRQIILNENNIIKKALLNTGDAIFGFINYPEILKSVKLKKDLNKTIKEKQLLKTINNINSLRNKVGLSDVELNKTNIDEIIGSTPNILMPLVKMSLYRELLFPNNILKEKE